MKTLTIQIPDNKYPVFLEMIKTMGIATKNIQLMETEPTKEQILDGIKNGVEEINLIKAGKKKAVLLKDFLSDL
jgi:hypothetical protein